MLQSFRIISCALCLLFGLLFYADGFSQTKKTPKASVAKKRIPPAQPYAPGPLFESDDVLEFTLSGRMKDVLNDRTADTSTYYPMQLKYAKKDSGLITIPLQVKSRGNFRRKKEHCSMPPFLLNLPKGQTLRNTVFAKQDKLKLVTPCRGDEYVIKEYLVYKLYNLLSPDCMKARLVKVTFNDTEGKVKTQTQYCILIEDEDKAARRSGYFVDDRKFVRMEQVRPNDFTRVAVFQYMIGNTDWSVPYLHNIRLAYSDSLSAPIAVPYDFDHSGIVSAPYAMPPEQLGLHSVRERRYRGICQDIAAFQPAFALFNRLKEDIYKLYTTSPYLEERYVKSTIKYLDDFYKTINNPKAAEREFLDPCRRKDRIVIGGYQNAVKQ